MQRLLLVSSLVVVLVVTLVPSSVAQVTITEPAPGSEVGMRPLVQGTVAKPELAVWVIVHPTTLNAMWVQPKVKQKGKRWQVQVYCGRPGSVDVGKSFEIRAVAGPWTPLKEGDVLNNLPGSDFISNPVTVRRTR